MTTKKEEKLSFDLKENFLWSLEEEVGHKVGVVMCRRVSDNKLIDVSDCGRKYCAAWLTKFLLGVGNRHIRFITEPHATVEATEKDLLKSGWEKRRSSNGIFTFLKPGDILVWEKKMIFGNENEHIGFFKSLSTHTAVSTCAELRCVREHHYTFENTRQILRAYFHPILQ